MTETLKLSNEKSESIFLFKLENQNRTQKRIITNKMKRKMNWEEIYYTEKPKFETLEMKIVNGFGKVTKEFCLERLVVRKSV